MVPQQAVASDAVAALQQEAARVAAEELPPAAQAGVEEGARQREAPDVRVAEPQAARPSVAPWVFHRDQLRPAPPAARQPTARFARAMQRLRSASP